MSSCPETTIFTRASSAPRDRNSALIRRWRREKKEREEKVSSEMNVYPHQQDVLEEFVGKNVSRSGASDIVSSEQGEIIGDSSKL